MSIKSRSRQYGKVFEHWQIKEFLGSGSGGKTAVFRLTRTDSTRGTSALKVVNLIEEHGNINTLPDFRRREYETAREECSRNAEQEVWLMDELRGNSNIVDYLDHTFVDWSDETGFGRDLLIRMELLKDLRSELRKGRLFTEKEILKIGHDICVALIRCHRKNILHRDVKPENIFRNKDGDYKLGDFGVSRVLDACPGAVASTGVGTYEYWPAEQMTGNYNKRVDIYSLGLVLYELSNQNRLPFATTTYATSKEVSLRLSGIPLLPPSEASPALAKVILKACAFDPDERYQSAEEFLRALNQVIRSSHQSAARPSAPPAPSKQAAPADDYATVLAKELGLPEDIFTDDAYRTLPAQVNETPQNPSFETMPAWQTKASYKTASVKSTKGKRRYPHSIFFVGIIALILAVALGFFVVYAVGNSHFAGIRDIENEEDPAGTYSGADGSTETGAMDEDSLQLSASTPQQEGTVSSTDAESVTQPVETQAADAQKAPKTIRVFRKNNTNNYEGIQTQAICEYDTDGYPIHETTTSNDKSLCRETYYIYNDTAVMDEVSAIADEGSFMSDSERLTRKRDLYNLLKNRVGYTGDVPPEFQLLCTDENGYVFRLASIRYYDTVDLLSLYDAYFAFDDAMNIVSRTEYQDGSKIPSMCEEYRYNEANQLISKSNPDYKYEYFYDSMGRLEKVTTTCLFSAANSSYALYSYDESGSSYTKEHYYSDGGVYKTEHKLDEYGNTIEQVGVKNGKRAYENHLEYIDIVVPIDQVETLCNTYDKVLSGAYAVIS